MPSTTTGCGSNPEDDCCRSRITALLPSILYAFRCSGPNWDFVEAWKRGNCSLGFVAAVDEGGKRFNSDKILFDPYARELSHDKETPEMFSAGHDGGIYATEGGDYHGAVCREVDSGHWAPKGIKQMVQAFHDEGLEVYLDVVFNHTGEGGNWGSNDVIGFVSFGGFDATDCYQLTENHALVGGATGCGNQLNFSNRVTQNLVMDSLTYWLEEMGVDGFRFDLAPVLGRHPDAAARGHWDEQKRFFQTHTLLDRIRDLGKAHQAEMIAEAWDTWG